MGTGMATLRTRPARRRRRQRKRRRWRERERAAADSRSPQGATTLFAERGVGEAGFVIAETTTMRARGRHGRRRRRRRIRRRTNGRCQTTPPLRVDFRGETRAASSISARRAATTAKATRNPWVVVAGRTHSSAEGGDIRPAQCQMPAQLRGRCPELASGNRRDDDGTTRTRRRGHEEVRGHREIIQSYFHSGHKSRGAVLFFIIG